AVSRACRHHQARPGHADQESGLRAADHAARRMDRVHPGRGPPRPGNRQRHRTQARIATQERTLEVFDAHQHFGPVPTGPEPAEFSIEADWTLRKGVMDKLGIDKVLLSPSNGFVRPNGLADTRRINDTAAEYRAAHPDRIAAALGIVE